ncbi:hypothetical protein H8E88_06830 [candidate division KSB1 bacterium]|nr:hypothetical protein [candidate division KSB1 bacterium]
MISFPGPLPPIDKESLENFSFDVRKYRNRRIGEFLKELHLTEGRSTGIPKILKTLAKNGSPKPVLRPMMRGLFSKRALKFIQNFFIQILKQLRQVSARLGPGWNQAGTKSGLSWD